MHETEPTRIDGPRETVGDLIGLIAAGDEEAQSQLIAHMTELRDRSHREGYKQAKRDMMLAVSDLELTE